MLHALLEQLDDDQIQYCVLRDGEELASQDAQCEGNLEIDLLVAPEDWPRCRPFFEERGFVRLRVWGYAPHEFFVAYDADADRWLKLDMVTQIVYRAPGGLAETALGPLLLKHRRQIGGVWVPQREHELLALLLHCILDKNAFSEKRREQLQVLCHEICEVRQMDRLLAEYWPADIWQALAERIEAEDWNYLLSQRQAVADRFLARRKLRAWSSVQAQRVQRKVGRWVGRLRSQSLSVALLAPDGAGKSTLAAAVAESFYFPVHLAYMGLYAQNGRRSKRRVSVLGLLGRLADQWRRYLVARWHQMRGYLVVFDRYNYDVLASSATRPGRLRRLRRTLLAYACPPPDLICILDAPGEVLFARKGEHSAALLEQQRQGYLQLARDFPQAVIVDATQDAAQVRRQILTLIWNYFAQRNGNSRLKRWRRSQPQQNPLLTPAAPSPSSASPT